MNCNEYREKFINEEMTPEEKKEFSKHLKECEACRKFVERYENTKNFIKIRTDYAPSEELKEKVVSSVKRRRLFKRLYTVSIPTVAIIIAGTFFVWKPFNSGQIMYQKVASRGIEMLKTNPSTSTSVNSNSDYSYMIKIKYASDQF